MKNKKLRNLKRKKKNHSVIARPSTPALGHVQFLLFLVVSIDFRAVPRPRHSLVFQINERRYKQPFGYETTQHKNGSQPPGTPRVGFVYSFLLGANVIVCDIPWRLPASCIIQHVVAGWWLATVLRTVTVTTPTNVDESARDGCESEIWKL